MLHIQRKKIISHLIYLFTTAGIACSGLPAYTQDLNLPDHDSKPYFFGITLGFNLARFNTEHHPRFLEYDTVLVAEPLNSGGFSLGLLATARLSGRLETRFNPQLMFTERNIFYKLKYPDALDGTDVTKKVESVIFTFPLQIKFRSDRIGNFRRSEEHTSELQSLAYLVCRLLLEKKIFYREHQCSCAAQHILNNSPTQ